MKNKLLARRIAVAMLVATTTFSAVPTSAVFAATIDAATPNATKTTGWTVNGKESTEFAAGSEEKTIGDALNADSVNIANDADDAAAVSTLQSAIDLVKGTHTWTVVSTTLKSKKGNGDVVVLTDSGKTLTYTFTTKTTGEMSDAEIEALDAVFEGTDAITYDGNTINTAVVQTAFNSALTKTKNAAAAGAFFSTSGAGKDYTYSVKSATVADGTVTGTIERTGDDGKIYSYKYTAKAVQNTDSKKATVKQALAAIESNTYPQPADATDGQDNATLKAKIQSDLNAALDGKATAQLGNGTVDLATRTSDGSYNASVDNNNVNVPLKYSSQSKLKDATDLAAKTTLKGARTADTLYTLKDGSTKGTTYAKNGAVKDASGIQTGKVEEVKKFSSTSAFSRSIQATTATEAVDADTVKDAVLKLFTDAADNAKYTGDGVTYTAETVKFGDADTDTADKTADATITKGGRYLIKVTASIDNDFYGWTIDGAEQKNSVSTATWYVEVETPKLKEVKNTSISFADKKVVYTTNAYAANGSSSDFLMKIDLKAALTPDDSNSNVTYSIVANDKKSAGKLGDGTTKYYTKASRQVSGDVVTYPVDSASAYTSKNSELYVPGAGTYKVSATANGKTATATITVLSKFNDVSSTAYYSNAVDWAYANGITAGVNGSTFGSNNSVTRGQYVTWLYKYAVSYDPSAAIADSDVKSVFSDVSANAFYAKAVQWAVANKVTVGTSATTFSPDAPITRAQALTMLWHVKGEPLAGLGKEDEIAQKFTDLPTNSVFRTAIVWAVKSGVSYGTTATTCSPDDVCVRSQAITFIFNAKDL